MIRRAWPFRRVNGNPSIAAAAQRLAGHSIRPLPFTPKARILAPPSALPNCIAVDGSHAILVDNGAIWVVATRAVAIHWPGPREPEPEPIVTACTPEEAAELVQAEYSALGLDAPPVPSAQAFAEALRDAAELRAARVALRSAQPNTLLLWDGALQPAPAAPAHAHRAAEDLLDRARSRQAPVAGVSKRSSMAIDGVNLPRALHRWGQEHHPDQAWAVPVPEQGLTHIARLHPRAPFCYRIDVTQPEVLDALVPLARDPVYLGYPYPLAVAHNTVALTAARSADLRDSLAAALQAHGTSLHLIEDPHDMLDRNVPG